MVLIVMLNMLMKKVYTIFNLFALEESEYYNKEVNVGLIGMQLPHENVLLNTVKDLTIYVVNSEPKDNNKDNNKKDEIDENIKNLLD